MGRWSQDTGSDNEMHSHKTSSPNPLPNPDITDTGYMHPHQNKMNMPPSLLENIQENYNMRAASVTGGDINGGGGGVGGGYDNDRYKYGTGLGPSVLGVSSGNGMGGGTGSMIDVERESIYGRKKDYQDNYGDYDTSMATGLYMQHGGVNTQLQQQQHHSNYPTLHANTSASHPPSHYGSEKDYGPGTTNSTQIVNQMRGYASPQMQQHHIHQQQQQLENVYHIYDKQRPAYLGHSNGQQQQMESPYMSKERIHAELYSPRDNQPYVLKSPVPIAASTVPVGGLYGSSGGGGGGIGVAESMGSVHSMLKNDYQVTQINR